MIDTGEMLCYDCGYVVVMMTTVFLSYVVMFDDGDD